ncbi:MAG: PQQ-binding-like beta-propeller repeat protein [bacterium]
MKNRTAPFLLAAVAGLLLSACSAGNNLGESQAVSEPLASAQLLLPAPGSLPRSSSASGAGVQGDAFSLVLPSNLVSADAGKGVFSPAGSGQPVLTTMAYAVYELDLTGINPQSPVSFIWQSSPLASEMWVGLSNWQSNRWDFLQPADPAQLPVSQISRYSDAGNRMFVALFVAGSSQAVLSGIAVPDVGEGGPGPGDWFMFGRNLKHQRRSPFTGPTDNNVRWSYEADGPCINSPSIAEDGTLYFGSYDFSVYAVNPDGTFKWSFPTEGEVESSAAIDTNGTIYIGSYDGSIYALNPDGSKKWEFITGAEVTASPAIGADGTIYCGSWDGTLYAINPDGTSKWTYFTGNDVSSSVAIADGVLYFGTEGGGGFGDSFYALDQDGNKLWSYETGDAVVSSPSIAEDGTIYVGCADHKLYAFMPDGSLKWSYTSGGEIVSTPAIGSDGSLYFGSSDMKIQAVDKDGDFLWSYDTAAAVTSSAALDAAGVLYIGCFDGFVRALSPAGSLVWEYDTGDPVVSSPSIGPDGAVYAGSANNSFYCFGTPII